jgi:hypothetical protein
MTQITLAPVWRALAIAVVSVAASAARAEDLAWTGTWTKEGGGRVDVKVVDDKLWVVAEGLDVGGTSHDVDLTGGASGMNLSLKGAFYETRGFTGALGGEAERKGKHACTLEATATYEKNGIVADASYAMDGAVVRREKWRRSCSLLEITDLRVAGVSLGTKELDVKDLILQANPDTPKTQGLEVKFVYRGTKACDLTGRIIYEDGQDYSGFYKNPIIFEVALKTMEPGEHSFFWSGRDQTSAARLAIQGRFDAVVVADKKSEAKKLFTVAAPHFEFASGFSRYTDRRDHLDVDKYGGIATRLMSAQGYQTTQPLHVTAGAQDLRKTLETSAMAILNFHGAPDRLIAYSGETTRPFNESNETPVNSDDIGRMNLQDLRVVLVLACEAGQSRPDGHGVLSSLLDSGCDVVIAFDKEIECDEGVSFELAFVPLLQRGATIEKAARDAGRTAWRNIHREWSKTDAEVDKITDDERKSGSGERHLSMAASLVVKRAGGAEDEADQFWPPRYGNSRH